VSAALHVRPIDAADRPAVRAIVLERWGSPIAVGHGTVFEPGELPGFLAERDGRPVGLLTYEVRGDTLEVVSIDAFPAGGGTGTALLEAAVRAAREEHGCRRVVLTTTNDNLDALRFYQRRGFRLVACVRGRSRRRAGSSPGSPRPARTASRCATSSSSSARSDRRRRAEPELRRPRVERRRNSPRREESRMSGGEAGQVTGTPDKDYNIIWFTEQCLSNVLRLEQYVQDAERAGDSELADFFRRAQGASRKGGEEGKTLLKSWLS
jgi:GNAT superfamily N-acetyltransferase